ncbi:integrase-like protein [Vibrio sp. ES.051]|nr:integrase-like protein [Vibrio sp. ES.051]PFG58814.1 integrase-like protein [Vibrio sp. ES.051]
MGRALITAYQMKGNGDNTKNICKSALYDFAKHLKENGVNDLRKVEKMHVLKYAHYLNERFENGVISASTAQNYLSKVNVAMEYARLDRSCRVDGVNDAGLPSRTGVAVFYKGVGVEQHQNALKTLTGRLGAQLALQREIGLRFKESCLINAKRVLGHALRTGVIRIEGGTKGGRLREFPVSSPAQIRALKIAAEIQKDHTSMVPQNMSWAQYQSQCYREISGSGVNFHGERHHYANARYETLTGVESPVNSGFSHGLEHLKYMSTTLDISLEHARQLDHDARLQVAQELGHGRVNITNNYLG